MVAFASVVYAQVRYLCSNLNTSNYNASVAELHHVSARSCPRVGRRADRGPARELSLIHI